jgi:hypothetical protein
MALTIDGSDPSGDLGDLLDDKLAVATAVSDYLPIAGGKVLQVVRATDSTGRQTSSTTFVDASISVTITPQFSTSLIYVFYQGQVGANRVASGYVGYATQITDSSNNVLGGSGSMRNQLANGLDVAVTILNVGFDTPGSTAAKTYKVRYLALASCTADIYNANNTGQLIAIEVSA